MIMMMLIMMKWMMFKLMMVITNIFATSFPSQPRIKFGTHNTLEI